eukprot:11009931-Heterocapsa_arctica.AAC.1
MAATSPLPTLKPLMKASRQTRPSSKPYSSAAEAGATIRPLSTTRTRGTKSRTSSPTSASCAGEATRSSRRTHTDPRPR